MGATFFVPLIEWLRANNLRDKPKRLVERGCPARIEQRGRNKRYMVRAMEIERWWAEDSKRRAEKKQMASKNRQKRFEARLKSEEKRRAEAVVDPGRKERIRAELVALVGECMAEF